MLEYNPAVPDEIARQIGRYVASIVNDGDTIQVGYGSMPNAIVNSMSEKNNLGIHTELLTQSMAELIRKGVVDNSKKSLDRGKTVAAFCMGLKETYEYIDDNPFIEFKRISYTNNPLVIAQNNCMTAINAALQIDLTGQATAESIGNQFFSGIGGSADFMRGAILSPGGKTILVLQSTARNGEVSRIVPFLDPGTGVTLNRGDINYVITEYGIAYIHGKNIRERAMDLIAIAHPKFRPALIDEAKRLKLIYRDQAFIPGKRGEYPVHVETIRTTRQGTTLKMRPVNINDETLVKDLFYGLSDQSFQRRFMSTRLDMPHERRQDFVVIDYTKELVLLAFIIEPGGREVLAGNGPDDQGREEPRRGGGLRRARRHAEPGRGERAPGLPDTAGQARGPARVHGRGPGGEPAHAPRVRKDVPGHREAPQRRGVRAGAAFQRQGKVMLILCLSNTLVM